MRNLEADQRWIDRLAAEARILGEARILRDEEPLTDEKAGQIIARVRQYIADARKSEGWAARSMGIPAASFTQVCDGRYTGDDREAIIRSIDKWTEQQVMRDNAPRPAGFVKTGLAEKIYAVAKWCQKINAIGVVHGPAGLGKTLTAQAIRAETPGSIYVRVTTAGQSKLAVFENIAAAMRIPSVKLTSRNIEQRLEESLRDSQRLIIIDEVHKLVEKRKDEALHSLRDLHDTTGCPMLWLGMSSIATYIQTGKTKYDSLDQLNSRIGWWLDLNEMAPRGGGGGWYTIDDIRRILSQMKIRSTADAERYLQMLANEPGQGGLRTITKLLQVAIAPAGAADRPITAERLRAIRREQLGHRTAEQIEVMMEQRMIANVG